MTETVDTLILGAGAAGLFCGARTAARGRRTLVLDHARKPAEKVRISGGGRCNFTNLETTPQAFLSNNPHFAKSALARYTPWDFCDQMARHGLTWHEKTLGQLFCDQKSGAVIDMLLGELSNSGGELRLETQVHTVSKSAEGFVVSTGHGDLVSQSLVVATGGLSIPKIGATPLAYKIADTFGHEVVATRPGLVPFCFSGAIGEAFASISGVSLAVEARCERGPSFVENMLFTHRGLSGPAMLQISSYWKEGEAIHVDLLPGRDAHAELKALKQAEPKLSLEAGLARFVPARLAEILYRLAPVRRDVRLAEFSNRELEQLAQWLANWTLKPVGTEGWRTAEVTVGGVDTAGLSSQTMASQHVPGLYFIGECVDVTGWLGGYNFQWAWASAAAAGAVA